MADVVALFYWVFENTGFILDHYSSILILMIQTGSKSSSHYLYAQATG